MPYPVFIITGFLGAGKTTFLQKLLAKNEFKNTAVIINELGQAGLDHALLEVNKEEIVLLDNGCICCSIRKDVAASLRYLEKERAEDRLHFERVVIETTGIADPTPIVHTLIADDSVNMLFEVHSVITLVDAAHGQDTLSTHPEAEKQVALADVLIISKADLVQDTTTIVRALQNLNPYATLVHNTDITEVVAAFNNTKTAREYPAVVNELPHARVQHFTVTVECPIPKMQFFVLLEAIATFCGPSLLRVKGLVNIMEEPGKAAVVHGVQHIFHPVTWLDNWPLKHKKSQFVFITTNPIEVDVRQLFAAILD